MDRTGMFYTGAGESGVWTHEADIEPALMSLVGRKLSSEGTSETTLSRSDLPPGTRVLQEAGRREESEHVPGRLTVVVEEDGTVSQVFTG